jgi:hypothetical protein
MEGYQLARQRAKQETKKWRTGVLPRQTGRKRPPNIAALYNQSNRK